ncbi:toll/interleukin-1 receptor domain-containing protein [Streptomyces antibioticus]|uniref:toll/interleukin-1 receptor domain-containing protein n=1 Tax=Streptomyces antibioticus TaxID=1890 RepID=UPI00224E7481|nr:toll/interleukin-1 receptor domain-containing protein [Streptomyces antibioticus]MCX4738116.1 toll/interleukin-1 receptor domain-containing protein [Streptomyces antibioticus]
MQVFVSYSSRDKEFVRRVVSDLERSDAEVSLWLDERELRVGQAIGSEFEELEATIAQCVCLMVVVSQASAGSYWVEREIQIAKSVGVRVLPVLLEDIPASWAPSFTGLAHVDFRRHREYRRSLHRLICAIEDVPLRGRFLHAKEAVALVKARYAPQGHLFGISQQGVATLYSLANAEDWEFADAMDGTSRFWIIEFCGDGGEGIQPFAVIDGKVQPLPELQLLDNDTTPAPDSFVVMSCALNHRAALSEERAAAILDQAGDQVAKIGKRYTRFRPMPLKETFIDSAEAINVATDYAFGPVGPLQRGADLFVLVSLERDKHARGFPTWTISFFDPALSESVLTIGVDSGTGAIRDLELPSQVLNARQIAIRVDEETGDIVLNAATLFNAMRSKVWDLPSPGLTAAEAVRMALSFLAEREPSDRRWQLAFLSNTGVVQTVAKPELNNATNALMHRDGTAGQWVVEMCGLGFTRTIEDGNTRYRYNFRQIVCTSQGATLQNEDDQGLTLTSPLSASPLPDDWLDACDRARKAAIHAVEVPYALLSVRLDRPSSGAYWFFRFYGADEIVAKVVVSTDGKHILQYAPYNS